VLARFFDCDEKTIRQMMAAQRHVPPSIATWMRAIARWHAQHPAPTDWRVRPFPPRKKRKAARRD
jgi:hypothetical protein